MKSSSSIIRSQGEMMTLLKDYQAFGGRHYETGAIHNVLAYQGVIMPHTGQPISEALLLGVSGGIAVGYFTFEYEGYRPHLALLTRNTFDPMETIFERLAIPREILQTNKAEKGVQNLVEVLEQGRPALVWADVFSLPHFDAVQDGGMWAMLPMVVYGYEDGNVYIADRGKAPFVVDAEVFESARARVKQDKFRVMMLDAPDMSRLPSAVSKGIWQCISLFTEAPPRGTKKNFGLAALENWANLLTNTRNKQSWARFFARGERMWMALVGDQTQTGAFGFIRQGEGNSAERGMYADFLDEAALILENSRLKEAADAFRESEKAWTVLSEMLLPDEVPLFKEAKTQLLRRQSAFVEQGSEGLNVIQDANRKLNVLREQASADFPLNEEETAAMREGLAAQVMQIYDLEKTAVEVLQSALA